MIEVWIFGQRPECVGHHSSVPAARRACRNDMGRTLTVVDAFGRVAAMFRDGVEL